MDIFDKINAKQFAAPLRSAAARYGITNAEDQARWLAQVSVESMGFTRVEESLNYTHPNVLLAVLNGRNGISTLNQVTTVIAGGPAAIAEALYGGDWGAHHLGNTQPGDGYRFIGRGLLQDTGRYNYSVTSQGCYGDQRLVETPELLSLADGAADSAAEYWYRHGLNGETDVGEITRAINGGVNALAQREQLTAQFLKLL